MMNIRKFGLVLALFFSILVMIVSTGVRSDLNTDHHPACSGLWYATSAAAGTEADLFKKGRTHVTRGQYQQAIPVLDNYLEHYADGRFASRARFFLAKAYLGMGDLEQAKAEFALTVRRYPDSLEAHKSRYKMALIDLWQGRPDSALEQFQDLADRPDGPLAPEAKAMAEFLSGRRI